ncbi:PAS domain-containing sensor histidine kinase [Flammeovirga aprica]|uniref:histidine kinase n=1 Tax=Flammeovirga aprica JL-4 TaxID=694437 RepID=A0A7X9S143_9BACT|nr:PAS domain-containing protein [Flammeovirga aprica]NME72324.1 PAS domain-containing protein [Flammeovirga aprica JL-4]
MISLIKDSKKRTFLLLFSLSIALTFGLLLTLKLLFENQQILFDSQVNRYNSYRLGDALKQSDDLLTEYCKNYVVTRDSIWEEKYWEVVAMREGKIPQGSGWTRSILDSMYHMGFSEEEFSLLKEALDNSNQLIEKETMAFNASKGLFLDSLNQYTVKGEVNMARALEALHSKDYLLLKKEIAEPLIKFESLIESRTKTTVETLRDKGEFLLFLTLLFIIVTILVSIITYSLIIKRLNQKEELAEELAERSNEQACLYRVSQLLENTDKSIEHVLESTVFIIPYGLKHADDSYVRITFNTNVYVSVNFKETSVKQSVPIIIQGEELGKIEVFYKSEINAKGISEEVKHLIETIATLLSNFYERNTYYKHLKKTNNSLQEEIKLKEATEKELRKSDERFTLSTKANNSGIWDLDVHTGVCYWSPIHYQILGYDEGEIIPTIDFIRSIIHHEDQSPFDQHYNAHLKEGKPLDHEARFFTKQKEIKWYHITGASSRNESGASKRIVGTFTDITEKKVAATALLEKEQQLQYALDVSNEGIWEIFKDTEGILFSERCYSMLGFEPDEEGENQQQFWQAILPLEEQSKALVNQIEKVQTEGFHDSIYRVRTKENAIKWIHTKGKAVEFEADNTPKRIVGTMSDITERMKQEEKIVNAVLETEDKERSRIAREIHDGLQQTMTTSLMSFEKLRSSLEFSDEKENERFQLGYKYLKNAIEESRNLAYNLMPKVVDENGIVEAVNALITAIQPSTKTLFVFDQNLNEIRLKLSIEMTLYRITQEAINNVMKYANAEKCTIQLLKHSDVLLLTIDDNGQGFDHVETHKTFGINSMRTRAESLGAYFEINSQKGRGTQILVELPLK